MQEAEKDLLDRPQLLTIADDSVQITDVNVVRMGCGITQHALFPPPFSRYLCSNVPF